MIALKNKLDNLKSLIVEDIRRDLLENRHKASGELINSIKVDVVPKIDGFDIEQKMAIQGEYVNIGRKRGLKGVPISALMEWIRHKNFTDGIKNTKGIAFAIQKKIIKDGIRPDPFIERFIGRNKSVIFQMLKEILGNEINADFRNTIIKHK